MSRDTVDTRKKGETGFMLATNDPCYLTSEQCQGDHAPGTPESYDTVPDSDDGGYSPGPMMGGMAC